MAIRNIVKIGDSVLTKKSRRVDVIDKKIMELLDDLKDTMVHAEGVGLAAVQVGILRRIAVVDIGEGLIELINPEIIKSKGEQTDFEGCLSLPGEYGEVTRPDFVEVKAQDREGKWRKIKGEGLLARALCHEIDHLDGITFAEKVTKWREREEG